MTTQCRSTTLFDGGHDFQLTQAQVVMLSVSPSGPLTAKDIRHLKRKPSHGFSLKRLQGLDRTHHLTQNIGGHLGIQRRGLQLFVPEQHLDNPNIHLLFQQMRGKAVSLMPSSALEA